ncbi:FixH family protein [Neptunicella sp.]|uniref:FixH family protein n=1 Tax=Neptunicella sp. TaxID=2125986 RepID=UPI003F6913A6
MNTPQPWYKQFWPWVLIILPSIAVIFSINMFFIAMNTEDTLVVDDYYKEGKWINIQLAKIHKAQELGIQGKLTVINNRIEVAIQSNTPLDGTALSLDFHHATLSKLDFHVQLLRNAAGLYVAEHSSDIAGKWQITLTPFDKLWKIQENINLPSNDAITLAPE